VRKAEQILKDKKGEIVGAFAKDKAVWLLATLSSHFASRPSPAMSFLALAPLATLQPRLCVSQPTDALW
jgi:hypothetical protein